MEGAPLTARLRALLTKLSQSLDDDQIAISASEKGRTAELWEKAILCDGAEDLRPSARAAAMTRKLAFVLAASFSNTPAR